MVKIGYINMSQATYDKRLRAPGAIESAIAGISTTRTGGQRVGQVHACSNPNRASDWISAFS
jgi:hypothetical protein